LKTSENATAAALGQNDKFQLSFDERTRRKHSNPRSKVKGSQLRLHPLYIRNLVASQKRFQFEIQLDLQLRDEDPNASGHPCVLLRARGGAQGDLYLLPGACFTSSQKKTAFNFTLKKPSSY